jgi:hypothetical protein
MGIATYLISSSAPQVGEIKDIEDEIIYKKILTDLDALAEIKESVHKWLLWIYIGVVALPIILV